MYSRPYYIVFKPSSHKPWWAIFLHKDFKHCFLITQSGKSKSIVIDPSNGGTGLYVQNVPAKELVHNFKNNNRGYLFLEYIAHEKNMVKSRAKLFRSCVGTCKDFLGIDAWWVITPYQLYKYIMRRA